MLEDSLAQTTTLTLQVANALTVDANHQHFVPDLYVDTVFIPQLFANQAVADLDNIYSIDFLDLSMLIQPDLSHQQQVADVFVLAGWNDMLFNRHNCVWKRWDGQPETMKIDQAQVTLTDELSISIFQGNLVLAGKFKMYLG